VNVKVLTDFELVNTVGELAIRPRLLDPRTEVSVLQSDAAIVAARGIDNLTGRDGTVRVDPVAPTTTVSRGRVGDLLAVASLLCC
jgi:hypothetical protein